MRKEGLEVNNIEAIKLPEQKISGPDENLESKEFPVWLKVKTINNEETLEAILQSIFIICQRGRHSLPK